MGSKKVAQLFKKRRGEDDNEGVTTMEIPKDLEVPAELPARGSTVIFVYGNPQAIGAPLVDMVTIVTRTTDQGLITGWAFTELGMTAAGPDGRPVALPPMIPVGNLPYSSKPKPLTWHYDDEGEEPEEESEQAEEESDA